MTLKDGRRCLRFSLRLSGCNYSVFTIIQVQIHAWIHVANTCMYIAEYVLRTVLVTTSPRVYIL